MKRRPDHSVNRAADPYAFSVLHRRLAWLLRLSAGINVALVAALICTVSVLFTLLPLKEVRVALLRADPKENIFFRVEPISPNVNGYDLILESVAQRYVTQILSIDHITEESRFKEVTRMTGKDYWKNFKSERIDSGALKTAYRDELGRSILTESASVVERDIGHNNSEHLIAVDFKQIDRIGQEITDERNMRAYLQVSQSPSEVSADDLHENPLGIIVTDMVIKEIKGSNSNQIGQK